MTVALVVTVSPGSKRTEIVARHGEGWKVRVAASPERGRANEALVALLSEALGIPQQAVRVRSGQTARRKVVEIDGLEKAEILLRLAAAARR